MTDLIGQSIKGYELRERIGAGGFGAVYRAYSSTPGRVLLLIAPSLTMACLLTSVFSTEEGARPNRTEPIEPADPYISPNPSLSHDLDLGSNGYVFMEEYADFFPTWSPDGSRIAFASNRDGDSDIYVIDADGSNLRNLTSDPSPVLATLLFQLDKSRDTWPSWSSAADKIAFSTSRTNIMMMRTPLNIVVMPAEGGDAIHLTDTIENDGVVDWSPDGEHLAFVSERDSGVQIYSMSASGEEVVRLSHEGEASDFPDWSPDGNWIVFQSNRDGDMDVYSMSRSGSEVVRLTDDPAYDGEPTWSPDGERIAFVSDRDGDNEIYLMDTHGGSFENLTRNTVPDAYPAWSPDGRQIAFSSETIEGWRIFVIDVDGSEPTQITGGPVRVSPEQNAVYYLHQGLAQYLTLIRSDEGDLNQPIESFSTAIDLDLELAEAYLGRGMALLLRCEIVWAHATGTQLQMLQDNDKCGEFNAAITDIEKALDLGLAPALIFGVRNLLELLQ